MLRAILSLIEPRGLMNSSLQKICAEFLSVILLSFTIGVLPIKFRTFFAALIF